jgi:Flp pilus assembly pilin Flp
MMSQFEAIRSATDAQIRRLCADQSGATTIEYAMIAAAVAASIAATVISLGSTFKESIYERLASIIS